MAFVAAGAGLGSPNQADAAMFFFIPFPNDAQLDGDPILDIATSVGAIIEYNIILNTGGLAAGPLDLVFEVSWDGAELFPSLIDFAPGASPFGGADSSVTFGNTETVTYSNLPSANGEAGTLTLFDMTVLDGLVNDGSADFTLNLISATIGGNSVLGQFVGFPQIDEVQPIPEPSTALLLALGGLVARRRRRR